MSGLWGEYKKLAGAVGRMEEEGMTRDAALAHLQARLEGLGSHTKLVDSLPNDDAVARRVLGV